MRRVKQLVHAHNVYRKGFTGKGVCAVILDTGAYPHKDLRKQIRGFKDFTTDKRECYDDNGHGTHVAGIFCANGSLQGVAPGARVIVLKVLDRNGNGNTRRVLEALDWVEKNKAIYQIRILNFSVGFLPGADDEDQKLILDKLERLWDDNVVVVAAAGNNGPREGTVTVPGISRKIITVGASDDTGQGRNMPHGYSGRGPTGCCIVKPEITAPGTNILSLDHRGNYYVKKSGTSMATPVVCGTLALALQKKPSLRPEELKLDLYLSARRQEKSAAAWGILDVDNLIDLI